MFDDGYQDDVDYSNLDLDESRFAELENNIEEAMQVGTSLARTSTHFSHLFAVLQPEERRKVLTEIYQLYKNIYPRIRNQRQFVLHVLALEETYLNNNPSLHLDNYHTAHFINAIINGNDYKGLSSVVAATTLAECIESEEVAHQIEELLCRALKRQILSSHHAAALISCVMLNQARVNAFERDADLVLVDYHIYGQHVGIVDDGFQFFLPEIIEHCTEQIKKQSVVVRPLELCYSFDLEQSPTGIFIPTRNRIVLSGTLRKALLAAERDRDSLLNMSSRRFEQFMADIFKMLGFEVELTLATRDGGADILCLKDLHGVPFRLAVEVKRFKPSRKIDVSLVRSFVGANKKFHANRLLYVTTSDYTKPAQDYATDYAGHILTLKKYEQIQEWSRECLNIEPRILGPDANLLP